MKKLFISVTIFLASSVGFAQEYTEEVMVVGIRSADSTLPGTSYQRLGDYLLLAVEVINDSREEKQRESEIHKTIKNAIELARKEKSIQLSTVGSGGLVVPLSEESYRIELSGGKRPDTSQTRFMAKIAIPKSGVNGFELIDKLTSFVKKVSVVGRTELITNDNSSISVINPKQYRSEVIKLFAEDVKNITTALGDGYRIVLQDMDEEVEWVRQGDIHVSLYIPYDFIVIPIDAQVILSIDD